MHAKVLCWHGHHMHNIKHMYEKVWNTLENNLLVASANEQTIYLDETCRNHGKLDSDKCEGHSR